MNSRRYLSHSSLKDYELEQTIKQSNNQTIEFKLKFFIDKIEFIFPIKNNSKKKL